MLLHLKISPSYVDRSLVALNHQGAALAGLKITKFSSIISQRLTTFNIWGSTGTWWIWSHIEAHEQKMYKEERHWTKLCEHESTFSSGKATKPLPSSPNSVEEFFVSSSFSTACKPAHFLRTSLSSVPFKK